MEIYYSVYGLKYLASPENCSFRETFIETEVNSTGKRLHVDKQYKDKARYTPSNHLSPIAPAMSIEFMEDLGTTWDCSIVVLLRNKNNTGDINTP